MTRPSLPELLSIDLPLIQAPMAGVQGSALAIAVSEAGALGSLPCAMLAPEALRDELRAIVQGTRRPFNVNFFCHAPPTPDAAREAAERLEAAGAEREGGPVVTPWQHRNVRLRAPDGMQLTLFTVLD